MEIHHDSYLNKLRRALVILSALEVRETRGQRAGRQTRSRARQRIEILECFDYWTRFMDLYLAWISPIHLSHGPSITNHKLTLLIRVREWAIGQNERGKDSWLDLHGEMESAKGRIIHWSYITPLTLINASTISITLDGSLFHSNPAPINPQVIPIRSSVVDLQWDYRNLDYLLD